jgi:hypothetical protein
MKGDRFFYLTAKPGLAEPASQIWEKVRRKPGKSFCALRKEEWLCRTLQKKFCLFP